MATYQVDFTSDAVGSPPSGWTNRYATDWAYNVVDSDPTARGGKCLKLLGSSTTRGYRLLSYDAMDSVGDADCLYRVKVPGSLYYYSNSGPFLWGRASGAVGSQSAYLFYAYGSWAAYLSEAVSGSFSDRRGPVTLGASNYLDFNYSSLNYGWGWMRFRVSNTSIKWKIWMCGMPEPSGWMLSTTDNTLSSGWWGIGNGAPSSETAMYCDYASFETGGGSAPFPSNETSTEQRIYQSFLQAALAYGPPVVKISGAMLQVIARNEQAAAAKYAIVNSNN